CLAVGVLRFRSEPKVNMDDEREFGRVSRRKTASNLSFCVKKENDGKYRKVYAALQKKEEDRSEEEHQLILKNSDLVKKARDSLKKKEDLKARSEEVEDPDEVLIPKCKELAAALRNSKNLVVYTGAGISTAAKIPDYRGSNGIWTLLQKGKDIGKHDLSQADPTLTHMALFELYSQGILKYVVSQNCDGLHLRSGLPRSALSEVHGNMHLEICQMCRPSTQYWRMFDVTENTGRFSHRTMRRCHYCHSALIDTIIHFGERGNHPWPLNWPAANKAADNADTILCIGSSLKVLKKYPWLWGMAKPARQRPKLYIINLQWTPKDDHAVLKINGRCDRVMQEVMKCLNLKIPEYSRLRDPIFCHATHLHPDEMHTTSQPELDSPFKKEEKVVKEDVIIPKQDMKRGSSVCESDCPMKLRKLDSEQDSKFSVKEECEIPSNISPEQSFDKVKEIENKVKQEITDSEQAVANAQSTWHECEAFTFFPSAEEIVEQTNSFVDGKISVVMDADCTAMFTTGNESESLKMSKDTIVHLSSSFHSKDEKENLDVCFTKSCSTDIIKTVNNKKVEPEKAVEGADLDKSCRAQNVSKAVHPAKTESVLEPCGKLSLKELKLNGKSNNDISEDGVVVLKMLQLEHNYSKSVEEFHDGKSELKEFSQDPKKDSKDTKKENQNETSKRNLRRASRDAVNYVEDDEDDTEEDESSEGDEGESSKQQSARPSRLAKIKQSLKKQEKEEPKKNLTEVQKKLSEGNNAPLKQNKSSKPEPPLKNKKLTKADFEMRVELKARSCDFCSNYYKSKACLFYPSLDFRDRQIEGCICECCDYSSESEEAEEEGSNGETNEGKGDSTDNGDDGASKSSVVNPGWYGKGCRKRIQKRK
ncbi:NAD-dependent protein deacetylase Sirt7, partial [Frankliniella fusca]